MLFAPKSSYESIPQEESVISDYGLNINARDCKSLSYSSGLNCKSSPRVNAECGMEGELRVSSDE